MGKTKKIILHDYQTVVELIKAFKGRVEIKRMGDEFSGVYYEVKLKIPCGTSSMKKLKNSI